MAILVPGGRQAQAAVRARNGGSPIPFAVGRWTAEIRGDEIADLGYDGVPLLRAIRPVVRDQDWNTVPVTVVAEERRATGMIIGLRFESGEIRYGATIALDVDPDELAPSGALTVRFSGRALSTFARNRIGLVVLHRADDAGRDVQVRHPDGTVDDARWPIEISPHQVCRDVAGFAWDRAGVQARLDLHGDVFETEDQRNWTDASFKTYSTPLDRPFPVVVAAGDQVEQSVRLTATGRRTVRPAPGPTEIVVGDTVLATVPPISLGAALYPGGNPASLAVLARSYGAVLVELTGDPSRWPDLLDAAAAQAAALDVPLDVRLVTGDPEVVAATVGGLAGHRVTRLAAYDPESHRTTPALWAAVRAYGQSAEIVGGTRAHFTELNRQQHDLPADLPGLTFSLTPQMHATEVPHLIDSLATQRTVIDNATRIAAGRPLHVGPITLRRRFNAVATGPRPEPAVEAERATDPLLGTDVAAAWTLGSVAALAVGGVASLAYAETCGPRGVVDDDGTLTPVGRLLDTVAGWRERPRLDVVGPAGTAVLATRAAGGDVEVLVADLTGTERTLVVRRRDHEAELVRLPPWSVASTDT